MWNNFLVLLQKLPNLKWYCLSLKRHFQIFQLQKQKWTNIITYIKTWNTPLSLLLTYTQSCTPSLTRTHICKHTRSHTHTQLQAHTHALTCAYTHSLSLQWQSSSEVVPSSLLHLSHTHFYTHSHTHKRYMVMMVFFPFWNNLRFYFSLVFTRSEFLCMRAWQPFINLKKK